MNDPNKGCVYGSGKKSKVNMYLCMLLGSLSSVVLVQFNSFGRYLPFWEEKQSQLKLLLYLKCIILIFFQRLFSSLSLEWMYIKQILNKNTQRCAHECWLTVYIFLHIKNNFPSPVMPPQGQLMLHPSSHDHTSYVHEALNLPPASCCHSSQFPHMSRLQSGNSHI